MAREIRIAIGCASVALATCCAGSTHQVVPTGHGTFVIPSRGLMGVSSAEKSEALEDAAAYCVKLGKEGGLAMRSVLRHSTSHPPKAALRPGSADFQPADIQTSSRECLLKVPWRQLPDKSAR